MSDVIGVVGVGLDSLGSALVERFGMLNVWTAAMLGIALVLDRALSRRVRASWRIALYAPVALRVLLPLGWSLRLVGPSPVDAFLLPLARIGSSPAAAAATAHPLTPGVLVAVAYLLVAALIAIRTVMARIRLARTLAGARPVPGTHEGIPCPVVEHESLGPMAVGLLAPRVVIPSRLLVPEQRAALACVLRHEAAHLRRRDAWLSLSMQVLLVVAWPVAPLWISVARVRQLVELACDEAAVVGSDSAERRRYGHALLDVAEWRLAESMPLAAGELHFGSVLRARIEALALQRHWPIAAQAIALAVIPAALFAACGGSTAVPGPAPGDKDYGYQFETDSQKAAATQRTPTQATSLNQDGRLPPETIQAIVRAHFGAFRDCYEAGLKKDPKLAGRVTVAYLIAEDGTTAEAADQGSTIPDKDVVTCVVGGFKQLTYPRPDGGMVTVVYPIEFAP